MSQKQIEEDMRDYEDRVESSVKIQSELNKLKQERKEKVKESLQLNNKENNKENNSTNRCITGQIVDIEKSNNSACVDIEYYDGSKTKIEEFSFVYPKNSDEYNQSNKFVRLLNYINAVDQDEPIIGKTVPLVREEDGVEIDIPDDLTIKSKITHYISRKFSKPDILKNYKTELYSMLSLTFMIVSLFSLSISSSSVSDVFLYSLDMVFIFILDLFICAIMIIILDEVIDINLSENNGIITTTLSMMGVFGCMYLIISGGFSETVLMGLDSTSFSEAVRMIIYNNTIIVTGLFGILLGKDNVSKLYNKAKIKMSKLKKKYTMKLSGVEKIE